MGTVILIGTVAIIVAIDGCFVTLRLDASRAEEVEHMSPSPRTGPELEGRQTTPTRPIEP